MSCLDRVPDEVLAARSKQGDVEATEHLIGKYRPVVLFKSRNYYLHGAERDDMIQEGMLGLFKATRDYRPDRACSFRTFADVCITRQMITAVKSSTGQRQLPLTHAASLDNDHRGFAQKRELQIAATAQTVDPEQLLITRETAQELQHLLREKLSPFEWRVFVQFGQGSSYQEIADALGSSPKSVDNALCRVRRKVAAYTKPIEKDLPARRKQAWSLRQQGLTYNQIGAAMGVAHITARGYVLAALAEEGEG